jgi:tellurite resistance protein TerC
MFALMQITSWEWYHYAGFTLVVLIFLALDLGVFHKSAHEVKIKEALLWSILWFVLAMAFAWVISTMHDRESALTFVTGYIIELSLSMDNVFAIAVIFTFFSIPSALQHRVLFWGILGALIMRGIMIGVGAAMVHKFHWLLYVMGGFLIFTGIKMTMAKDEGVHPDTNPVIRLVRRFFPVSSQLDGQKFLTRIEGRRALTPLSLVLVLVETTDLVFAVDSIPAIFAVTQETFIVFTSNVFAILGLRSLYFVLSGAISYFRYLKFGLSIVLVFIGVKMLVAIWYEIPTIVSLGGVGLIIGIAMGASIIAAWREKKAAQG